jgi:hypothetical protein
LPGLKRSSGRIGLQQHTGEVRFRNIEIEELPPPGKGPAAKGFLAPDGWHGLTGFWSIRDGAIQGASGPEKLDFNTFLCSRKKYRDFELQFRVRVTGKGWAGNSGVQVRSTLVDAEKFIVRGPQCDIGEGYWGSLYGELCGGMMKRASWEAPERGVKPAAFNDYFIRCRGKRVTIRVNGRTTVDDEFARLPEEGIIAWQLHGGRPMTVTFKDIVFRELPPPEKARAKRAGRLFNGEDLTGWEGLPGYWRAQGGALVGACPPGRPAHTFLVSQKAYKDFDLKFEARRKDGVGNSGVQFRSRVADRRKCTVVGPQCEIDSARHAFPPGSLLTEPDLRPLAVRAPRAAVAAAYRDAGFNAFHIRCVGKHVTIKVNGVTTIDDDYPCLPDEGVLAWQLNGHSVPREVTFRNIEFTDLTEGLTPLPLRKGLPGWSVEGGGRGFRGEEGVLVATSPHWMSREYLLSERQYGDYRLRFECQLEKGANSGVVVRGYRGERSNIGRPGAIDHPVIKLTDAGAYPKLPPGATHWVASGSHDGPGPREAYFPVGEWNAVEVEVRGKTCQVWVNNAPVVRLRLDEANRSGQLLAGLAREKGYIGFQANVGTARFRNVEAQELPAPE